MPRKKWETGELSLLKDKYVSGAFSHKELAEQHQCSISTIRERAKSERWPSPKRIMAASKNTQLTEKDPAKAIATKWKERKEESREQMFTHTTRALERFWASAPTPQDFQEAAIAAKLQNEAISPKDDDKQSNQLAFLITGPTQINHSEGNNP